MKIKKKGFTLIEILTTTALLGVVLIPLIQVIPNMFQSKAKIEMISKNTILCERKIEKKNRRNKKQYFYQKIVALGIQEIGSGALLLSNLMVLFKWRLQKSCKFFQNLNTDFMMLLPI